jgi:hypothetical protein
MEYQYFLLLFFGCYIEYLVLLMSLVHKPEVVNLRTCRDFGKPGDVRIDRTTKWGNPFPMIDSSLEERNRVCGAYKVWFENQTYLKISDLANAKRLGCWCAPLRCHGDYLAKRIEEYNEGLKTI